MLTKISIFQIFSEDLRLLKSLQEQKAHDILFGTTCQIANRFLILSSLFRSSMVMI